MTEIKNMFTTGNAITIGGMIIGGAIAWGALSAELALTQAGVAKMEARIGVLENSVSGLSVQFARNDERLLNILNYVQRTDARLGVIEQDQKGSPRP